jgi:signal transduction histidine kinase/ActR/RegA family two-component response regulator
MKKSKKKSMRKVHFTWTYILAAVPVVILIAVIYIVQLNKTVSESVNETISELAKHDQKNILENVQSTWDELDSLIMRFDVYQCETIEEVEEQMNLTCASSSFSHVYMVAEDGKVYTDKFLVYDPASDGLNGRVDFLPYFTTGEDYFVRRFDDVIAVAGITSESVAYGVRMDGFTVEGIPMVGIVGISDITSLQDSMVIDSFTKDGESRGYSVVINKDGDYIVNVERTVFVNDQGNFFERLDKSQRSDYSRQAMKKKMNAGDTFTFRYTEETGESRVVYCMPFDEIGIPWYFLLSVDEAVFTEQNQQFLVMSMGMLAAIVIVILVVLAFVVLAQRKVIMAKAEASARSNFLANMSHEIRTPLNGIIGLLYLTKKDLENGADRNTIEQRLVKTTNTADYLLSLINNILDISKLQAGRVEINNDVISPELILDAIWSMQKNNIEGRGIEFVVKREISVPWIIGDELLIKQILMNILGNAAKFTPAGGRITFSVTQKKEDAHHVATTFICQDTGCGMSEAFLDHIWDSFSQEKNKSGIRVKGTGLGMAISKLLTDAMHGEIRVESKLEEGSTFYVTLHSEIAKHSPAHLQENRGVVDRNGDGKLKILVVEDNELNAEILIDILESEGFETVSAENGEVAVKIFSDSAIGEIDVILMDMQMPIMDGCAATVEIRKLNRADAKTVPIFACTANNFSEDRERAEKSGMNDFLSKPIDVDELLKKINGKTSGNNE